jgi:hypothetical protein
MTYQDPDPLLNRDLDRNAQIERDRDYGSNAMWGWIAGAVVLVLMLVFLFGGSNETNTASNASNKPSAPIVNTPPANNMATAPRANPTPPASSETTGQSSSPRPSPSPGQQ